MVTTTVPIILKFTMWLVNMECKLHTHKYTRTLNFINVFIIQEISVIKSIFAKSTKGRRDCQNALYLNDDVQTLNNGNMN